MNVVYYHYCIINAPLFLFINSGDPLNLKENAILQEFFDARKKKNLGGNI
jgi:hypothetical protein